MSVTFKLFKETAYRSTKYTITHAQTHTHTIHTLEMCQAGILIMYSVFDCQGMIEHGGEQTLKFSPKLTQLYKLSEMKLIKFCKWLLDHILFRTGSIKVILVHVHRKVL